MPESLSERLLRERRLQEFSPAADYESHRIPGIRNPHPDFGYVYGPVLDLNPGWKPSAWLAMSEDERCGKSVTAKMIQDDIKAGIGPPRRRNRLNKVNSQICPVTDRRGGLQCGMTYESQSEFWDHLRTAHSGCFQIPDDKELTFPEHYHGRDAQMQYVFLGAWRTDKFVNEPGRGPTNNWMHHVADNLEELSSLDPDFAETHGSVFHRSPIPDSDDSDEFV